MFWLFFSSRVRVSFSAIFSFSAPLELEEDFDQKFETVKRRDALLQHGQRARAQTLTVSRSQKRLNKMRSSSETGEKKREKCVCVSVRTR